MFVSVRRLLPLLAALAALLACAPVAAGAEGPPRPVLLDQGWEFQATPGGPWKRVSVPHVFDGRANEAGFDGTTGTYRLRFRAPATTAGFGWGLRFEGVRRRAQVLLNGRQIGANADPYTGFQLDAPGLRPGAENLLTVKVDNVRTPGFREGWWNWGGITRRVHLVPLGGLELRDVALLGDVDCSGVCKADVRVDGWITNRTSAPQRPVVAVQLREPGGDRTAQRTLRLRTVRPGETARVQFDAPVPGDPRLWAPEDPQLYSAVIQARIGTQVVQTESEKVGLRTVEVRKGRLLLNGRPVMLRGASIQEDVYGRGPAMTDEDVDEIVRELKAVGAKITRAHYLLDDRLLDAFDEAGIMVWSQAPVYHRDVQLRDAAHRTREVETVRRTVLAARKHPSVITHSVANELSPRPDDSSTTKDFIDRAARVTRDLDPTVPASIDILAWPGFDRQEAYAQFDLIGVNSYFGWYDGDEEHPTADFSDLEPFLTSMHKKYPRQALVMTEFGAEAVEEGPANLKETFAFQARYLQANLDVVARQPFMSGAIYWTLREFAVKPNWIGGFKRPIDETDPEARDGIHDKGLIEYETGKRKPAWSVAARDFKRTPLYRSAAPRAVAAAVGPPPEGPSTSAAILAFTTAILMLLLLAAAVLIWLLRDVLRFGGRPPAAAAATEQEAGERRLRAVA
jgi:beta-glucuronidase